MLSNLSWILLAAESSKFAVLLFLCSKGRVSRFGASLMVQTVKKSPAMRETWVQSLSWEDPLEEGMATRSSILAWRIPMDRGTWGGGHSPWGRRVRHN